MKKVYTIIVTYNGMQWIERCLSSLINSTYPSTLIVIDNGSRDETASFIRKNFPVVQVIETGKNCGFGQANNTGLKIAIENGADYVFLLNQDAWVETDTICGLIEVQTASPAYGVLSPLHVTANGKNPDPYFLDYLIESEIKPFISSALLNGGNHYPVIPTHFVNAAAWLISAGCLKTTGGFDPIFFHYGEDINYAHRVLFNGFKIGICTGKKIFHDREDRILKTVADPQSVLKKEWIHFLTQACDIRQKKYKTLILKRALRHGMQAATCIVRFNKTGFFFNYTMSTRIIASFPRISKSRKISGSRNAIPHLQ